MIPEELNRAIEETGEKVGDTIKDFILCYCGTSE